ncbi:MAG: glycosyltransferase family 4 protein [Solirubrobacterales bacterium]
MRILLVCARPPLPLDSGGQVRVWNVARQLARRHRLDLLTFVNADAPERHEDALRGIFENVAFVPRRRLESLGAALARGTAWLDFVRGNLGLLLRTALSSRPLVAVAYDSPEMRGRLLEADRQGYDLIHAETFPALASVRAELSGFRTPVLLIEQNVESLAFGRQADEARSALLRPLMRWDVRKLAREELQCWRSVRVLGAPSEVDASHMHARAGRPVLVLENGVDAAWFSEEVTPRRDDEVLFLGSFRYFQNVDALHWLLEEIWPRVIAGSDGPRPTLRIVGRGADDSLRRFVDARGFAVDERVDDVRHALQRATLLIAPLRAGSGTKFKVLEAMASGLPVVTTPTGAEGLPVESRHHLLIAEGAAEAAGAVRELLGSPDLQKRLAGAARALIAEGYDWARIVDRFESRLAAALVE